MQKRDEFTNQTKERLAKRVGYRCSNPDCRQPTSGPQELSTGVINVGVAAHITAASPGGPRYDVSLSPKQRSAPDNGIWLCQKCAKLVDSDTTRYTVNWLKMWKKLSENDALKALEGRSSKRGEDRGILFAKVETLMPELLSEMREDLTKYHLRREFVLLKKGWSYWASGTEFMYYYEDHDQLDNKVRILENCGLIRDITSKNVNRFVMTEKLADYLCLKGI